jgi:hypothetical protein
MRTSPSGAKKGGIVIKKPTADDDRKSDQDDHQTLHGDNRSMKMKNSFRLHQIKLNTLTWSGRHAVAGWTEALAVGEAVVPADPPESLSPSSGGLSMVLSLFKLG